TAVDANIPAAIERCYRAVKLISWPGAQYRLDIGQKALKRLR
ncbi:MAG: hypothetical protein KAW01_05840, partial [Deltaproteobacteria bacterium]|nr:hypothetical protein [Deltaproteobacteria bacterium]